MKVLKTLYVAALVLTLGACSKSDTQATAAEPLTDREAIRTEIRALETRFEDAINTKTIAGISEYYADDAESYLTGSEVLVGKEAIVKSTEDDFKSMPRGNKVEYTMVDLFISNDGNQAVEMGSYRATNSAGVLQRKGNFMAVFAKRNGKFVCIRDIDCPQ